MGELVDAMRAVNPPTFGWKESRIPGDIPKEPCCVPACGRLIRSGVSPRNHAEPGLPGYRVMCYRCWRTIMVEGRDPSGEAPPTWATESEGH